MPELCASDKEAAALQRFKEKIEDTVEKSDSFGYGDPNYIKFLRARELNVDKAVEMYRKHLVWREENYVKNARTAKISPSLEENIPVQVCGFDRKGLPIGIMPFGRWKLRRAMEKDHGKEFVEYIKLICQEFSEFALMNKMYQISCVIDFEGWSIAEIASRDSIESLLAVLRIFEANYPECLRTCTVVNAPAAFPVIFSIVKPLLSFHTLSKVKIYGTNRETWRPILHEQIDPEELPSRFGGTKTTVLDYRMRYGHDIFPVYPVFPDEDLTTVQVAAGDCYVVELTNIQEGSELSWNFKTEQYNIMFYFTFNEDEKVFDRAVTDSHLLLQKGLYVATKSGKYALVFDNTHSKFRSKRLTYGVKVTPPPRPEN